MIRIGVDMSVFKRFPSYRRGLVVARRVSNRGTDSVLEERLRTAEQAVAERFAGREWRQDPRIAAWLSAFGELGIPAGSKPPSIAAMVKRVAKGGRLPFINKLVALMNVTSLENLVPCGGDDLHAVGDEIRLQPATGIETYRALGAVDTLEHPVPGEFALIDTVNGVVLCRYWCWRNSDITKITEDTTAVALDLDLMGTAVPVEEGGRMVRRLAEDVERFCGGYVDWELLTQDQPERVFQV